MRKTARLFSAVPLAAVIGFVSAPAASAASAVSVAYAAPASRSALPSATGWRVAAAFPAGSSVDDVAVAGRDSAWAVEDCTKPCASTNGVILRHWNGKAWQTQPQPAVTKHTGDDEPLLAVTPGSKDVWAVYNIYDHQTRASAVEWTGKSWGTATLFHPGVAFTSVVAAGPTDVWGFGTANDTGLYAARYDGKKWSTAPSPGPGIGTWVASAWSASDIWAQSGVAGGVTATLAVSHWNGKRWAKQPVPAAPSAAQGGSTLDITVSGPANVWTYGYFGTSANGDGSDWLLHFNGKTWSNVRIPYPINAGFGVGPVGSDGRGGAWFGAVPAGQNAEFLYHVSAAGHWLKRPVPAPKGTSAPVPGGFNGPVVEGFALAPGSGLVYAYGRAPLPGVTAEGFILEYGA